MRERGRRWRVVLKMGKRKKRNMLSCFFYLFYSVGRNGEMMGDGFWTHAPHHKRTYHIIIPPKCLLDPESN